MKALALVSGVAACAALIFIPLAGADPTEGHFVNVTTQSPPMRCQIGSDESSDVPGVPGVGPSVVCQTEGFPQAPANPAPYPGWTGDASVLHRNQAIITGLGRFTWRTANLGMSPPGRPDVILVDGQTSNFHGWTIVPTRDGATFTNDVTGHGMFIGSDYSVKPF
jgi:hypothetical protein